VVVIIVGLHWFGMLWLVSLLACCLVILRVETTQSPLIKHNNTPCSQIKSGAFGFPPTYWSAVSEQAKDFIRRLIVVDPAARMTLAEALEHPWLASAAPQ
jgi:serine/threonine protein kinase